MKRLRVLHLIPTLYIGGAELDMVRKARVLASRGDFEIFILPFQSNGPLSELVCCSPRVKVIPPYKEGLAGMLITSLKLPRLLRQLHPHIIHLHMFRGELVGLFPSVLRKAPATVYTVQHMADADPLWKRVFSRVTVKYKDRIIASSQAVKGALVAYTHLPAEKIEVIYNSVDFSKVEEVTHSPPNPEQPIIGTVTRLHPDKGIQYFIKAFPAIVKEFPKAQGWIIGDGEEKVKLQALAEELGIRDKIKFWGWVREPYHLLSQMSLFVFPSVTEALGIALIEALGLGVPAVASNVGGIPEVLEKKPEWLVPPCQPMELAKKSLEILCNYPQARKAAQELSRLVREKFDVKRLANQQGKLYRELVEGG